MTDAQAKENPPLAEQPVRHPGFGLVLELDRGVLVLLGLLAFFRCGIVAATSSGITATLSALVDGCTSLVLYVLLARAVLLLTNGLSNILHARALEIAHLDSLASYGSRLADSLEQISVELKTIPRSTGQTSTIPDHHRQSIASFEQSLARGDVAQASLLLETHMAEFPGDNVSHLEDQLSRSRSNEIEKNLALLEAARQVNDPDRVLEVFKLLELVLDAERRQSLERELARWFLSLVHRRLRSGLIQPDVVALAQKVSDNFASTVEGASLRAALPTMRRSVGLCPRCAQPYLGSADACPKCLGTNGSATANAQLAEADEDSDFVDDDSELDDSPVGILHIDESDLENLRLIDPELDDDESPDNPHNHGS